ncbi:MAG: carbohydrate kinase family protein [Gammaproteobacteria bacterium]
MSKQIIGGIDGGGAKSGRVLVSGSFCYDVIFDCCGGLEAAAAGAVFFAPDVRRVFGGCGGNIAYGLAQLGDAPLLAAAAGKDWQDYRAHLAKHNIDDRHILVRDDCWTAMAFVMNDENGGQMTVFHPGASVHSHRQNLGDIAEDIAVAIVSPNAGAAMMKHSRELFAMKTPFVFDPGQAISLLSADELREALEMCACAIFNAGEFAAALATMGGGEKDAVRYAGAIIITDGEEGSRLLLKDGGEIRCAAMMTGKTADTTGCGDAYRAGLLHGMLRGWQWRRQMQFAATMAGIKAQTHGGQQYQTTAAKVETRRRQFFN